MTRSILTLQAADFSILRYTFGSDSDRVGYWGELSSDSCRECVSGGLKHASDACQYGCITLLRTDSVWIYFGHEVTEDSPVFHKKIYSVMPLQSGRNYLREQAVTTKGSVRGSRRRYGFIKIRLCQVRKK